MSYQEISVLSDSLKASSRGEPIKQNYQAVLCRDDNGRNVVRIMQCAKGIWSCCGTWHLSTLLYGYPACLGNKPSDGLSLDYGQKWQIDSGMHDALSKAIESI